MMNRRILLSALSCAAVFPGAARGAWPDRPITILHGFAAGGGADITARLLAEGLSKKLSQTVLVEPKPGAGTTLAAAQLTRAAPDGYTLSVITSSYSAGAALYKKLSYDPVKDIRAISLISTAPYVFSAHRDYAAKTLQELIAIARTSAHPVTYGTPGVGSGPHLSVELLSQLVGVKLQHIPFRGGAQAVTELLAQRIDFMVDPPLSMLEQIKAGTFRALAVTTKKRFGALPEVPTVAEAGFPDYEAPAWFGLIAPAGIPEAMVQTLNEATVSILSDPSVASRLSTLGGEASTSSPIDLATLIQSDIKKWTTVIDRAKIERL